MTTTRNGHATQRGQLIAATWLIGLGIVFLAQQAANLSWSQAWPMLVILVGVATLVSAALERRYRGGAGIWAFTWPVAWIVVGSILLASTTGSLALSPSELIGEWGPWLAIGLGVWFILGAFLPLGRRPTERLALPLDGATEAAIRVRFGAGELETRAAPPGQLVDGTFEGGVTYRGDGPGRIELQQDTSYGVPWFNQRSHWSMGLPADVPLDLRLDTGASRATLDLRDTRLRSLELKAGASDVRVLLPRAAGASTVKVEAGAASVTLEVPVGVAARIRTRVGLGTTNVDQTRFPRTAAGYESTDYATAPNRVDIDLQGGVGTLRVVGAA